MAQSGSVASLESVNPFVEQVQQVDQRVGPIGQTFDEVVSAFHLVHQ